jgi:hypothetical protein
LLPPPQPTTAIDAMADNAKTLSLFQLLIWLSPLMEWIWVVGNLEEIPLFSGSRGVTADTSPEELRGLDQVGILAAKRKGCFQCIGQMTRA